MKIPKRTETIKRHIEKFEKQLKSEKRKFGFFDDSGGIRYFIGPYYVLAGDVEGALKHFKWFDRVFSDDMGEPGQYLCWTLALYRSGDFKKAYIKFVQTLFMNPFVIARVIGIDYKLPYKPSSNVPTKEWADWVPDEFYDLWDTEAVLWLKDSFHDPKTQSLLNRFNALNKKMDTEPVGSKRTEMVEELFDMRKEEMLSKTEFPEPISLDEYRKKKKAEKQ